MYDDLLRFTGTSGNALTSMGSAATTGAHTGQYVGAERYFLAYVRIHTAGTGATGTFNGGFQHGASDTTYSNFNPTEAFAARSFTSSGIEVLDGFSVVGTTNITGNEEPSRLIIRTPSGRPWVRAVWSVGGTTAIFNGVSIVGVPVERPAF